MNIKKSDKKSITERNQKAASILRTIDSQDLTKVAGGLYICKGCGLAVSEPDPLPPGLKL